MVDQELVEILRNNGIKPVLDEQNKQPLIWLTGKFVAVEVDSSRSMRAAIDFFKKIFDKVDSTRMRNGNYLIKASKLKEKVKKELSH